MLLALATLFWLLFVDWLLLFELLVELELFDVELSEDCWLESFEFLAVLSSSVLFSLELLSSDLALATFFELLSSDASSSLLLSVKSSVTE